MKNNAAETIHIHISVILVWFACLIKAVFRQIRWIRCAYELLRCLDLEVQCFCSQQQ